MPFPTTDQMISQSARVAEKPFAMAKRQFVNPIGLEAMTQILRRTITLKRLVVASQSQRLAQRTLAGSIQVGQRLGPRVTHLKQQASRKAATQLELHSVVPCVDVIRGQRHRLYACAEQSHRWINHKEVDRKSTRLNSSHLVISYAVFCL